MPFLFSWGYKFCYHKMNSYLEGRLFFLENTIVRKTFPWKEYTHKKKSNFLKKRQIHNFCRNVYSVFVSTNNSFVDQSACLCCLQVHLQLSKVPCLAWLNQWLASSSPPISEWTLLRALSNIQNWRKKKIPIEKNCQTNLFGRQTVATIGKADFFF